jgi:protein TonB
LGENVHYPKELEEKGVTGKVFVEFTIDKTGKIKDIHVKKSSDQKALDNEVIRVIKKMPSWKPAQKDGKAVSMQMTIPIVFAL